MEQLTDTNYTRIKNSIIEKVLTHLSKNEIIIFLYLIRMTKGFNRSVFNTQNISISEALGIAPICVSKELKSLDSKGLVQISKVNRYKICVRYEDEFLSNFLNKLPGI